MFNEQQDETGCGAEEKRFPAEPVEEDVVGEEEGDGREVGKVVADDGWIPFVGWHG